MNNAEKMAKDAAQKEQIIEALRVWINQRPGLEAGNYITPGDWQNGVRAYRQEARGILADLHDARELLAFVAGHGITGAELLDSFSAYCGRLTWDGSRLEYCAGLYWPTEYRRAVCAVLAQAVWGYFRGDVPEGTERPGDYIRGRAKANFSRRVARRWFN